MKFFVPLLVSLLLLVLAFHPSSAVRSSLHKATAQSAVAITSNAVEEKSDTDAGIVTYTGLATTPTAQNPLAGMSLHYLIGVYNPSKKIGVAGRVTEVGYSTDYLLAQGVTVAYCNLFDETNSGKYGPYLHNSDTASQYNEGQIDPSGPGWNKNLNDQFKRRKASGFQYVELDNPDAYNISDVLKAVDLAQSYGLRVIAKNAYITNGPKEYLAHPNVYGVIVEEDCGTPSEMDSVRIAAGKPDLPVWFVSFDSHGKTYAEKTAKTAKNYKNMGVSFSASGEYYSATDVVIP